MHSAEDSVARLEREVRELKRVVAELVRELASPPARPQLALIRGGRDV